MYVATMNQTLGSRLKRSAALVVAAVVVGAPLALSSTPASAQAVFAYGGTLSNGSYTSYAYLRKSGTHLQVRGVQICSTASGQTEFLQYGPWVSYGKTSRTAKCLNSRFHGSGIDTRHV